MNSGGQESIHFGGKDIGGTINSGGELFVKSGGVASRTTVIGLEIVSSGGFALANIIQGVGATGGGGSGLGVSGFGLASGTVLKNGGEEGVFSGGTDIGATVSSGGGLFIHSGGIASGATIKVGGLGVLDSGGALSGTTTVSSGGTIEFIGTDASNNGLKLLSGATGELGSGAFLTDAKISKGITFVVLSGGIASGGTHPRPAASASWNPAAKSPATAAAARCHRQRRHLRICQRHQRRGNIKPLVGRHA